MVLVYSFQTWFWKKAVKLNCSNVEFRNKQVLTETKPTETTVTIKQERAKDHFMQQKEWIPNL